MGACGCVGWCGVVRPKCPQESASFLERFKTGNAGLYDKVKRCVTSLLTEARRRPQRLLQRGCRAGGRAGAGRVERGGIGCAKPLVARCA